MSYVVFSNIGEIDPRAITTFGISVKENKSPIGYFGTGLKYAIAIILRSNCKITIISGELTMEMGLKKTEMRGKEFQIITLNGAELPFTAELGKNWEMWQAFREIYCNCLDEEGNVSLIDNKDLIIPSEGRTHIIVEGDDFLKQYHARDSIVINRDLVPIVDCPAGQIFDIPTDFIYYRGIRVQNTGNPAMLTYNIMRSIDLTEDRTVKYSWESQSCVNKMICRIDDTTLAAKVLNAPRDAFENGFNMCTSIPRGAVSDTFLQCLERDYLLNKDTLNKSSLRWFAKYKNKQALKNYEEISLTSVEKIQLDKCIKICSDMYPCFKDYKIKVVKTLGENTMALADKDNNTMVFSHRCFTLGTKYLLSTMLEEYYHLSTGYADLTRELQTYLFDTVTTLIENHVIQEPI